MKHDALHFYTIELLTFLMHLKKKKKKKLFLFKSHKCVKKKTIHTRLTHNYAYAAQAYKYKHPHWAVGGGKPIYCG